MVKFFYVFFFCVCGIFLNCSENSETPLFPKDEISENMEIKFSGWKVDFIDSANKIISVSPIKNFQDSIIIESVNLSGISGLYFAMDGDLVDPELGERVVSKVAVNTKDTNQFSLVALDSYNRILCVWLVQWQLPENKSSSSLQEKSSSSNGSSISSSSSSFFSSSSSSEMTQSSSAITFSSSKNESSSSSEEAAPTYIKVSDLSVEEGVINISEHHIYIEMPYGSDLSRVELNPLDSFNDFRRTTEMKFIDNEGNVGVYHVIAGVQLPGSDFAKRNDFWATTSDAMGTNKKAASITISSETNLLFDEGKATIITKEVEGSFLNIGGSWKMAGGFYFTGSYFGTSALDIYDQGYSSGTPSTDNSDISKDMSIGKPFMGRPSAFELKYGYNHEANSSLDYPQKCLIYVLLVGEDNVVVATGAIIENSSVEIHTQKVELNYGADPFEILTGGYPIAEGLTLGTGDEDVVEIHVMFTSSAYAYVVAGGLLGSSDKYRGGENSALTLEDFKLIY